MYCALAICVFTYCAYLAISLLSYLWSLLPAASSSSSSLRDQSIIVTEFVARQRGVKFTVGGGAGGADVLV